MTNYFLPPWFLGKLNKRLKPISALLTETINEMELMYLGEDGLIGLSTGFKDVDALTSGLQKKELIIVAGCHGIGKTTFAMNIAEYVAVSSDAPVAIFSMDMSGVALTMRMISSLGRINQQAVRYGMLEDEDWPRITSAVNILGQIKIFIDDSPALTPTNVRTRCRSLMKNHGKLSLVVLDYLQLMKTPQGRENRTAEIFAISRDLKALATELDVPVIGLSQLSPSLELGSYKHPIIADLPESEAIKQNADLIIFICRDEIYNKESSNKDGVEVIVGKKRNDPIGTTNCHLTFQGEFARFVST